MDDNLPQEDQETLNQSNQASVLVSLEELIKNHIDSIDKLRDELKQVREMFDDTFINNQPYNEISEQATELNKKKGKLKQEITKQPAIAQLAQKMKDLRFDLSEQSKTLSALLEDYKTQTGATQIETHNGQVLDIVSTAKLVRHNSK